jgi:SAM-dependent methyltransferase
VVSDSARARQLAAFGDVVDEYERGRPNYPLEAVRWLVEGARSVVDLGAGTGKLTRALTALAPKVAAVEPQQTMVARLHELSPEVRAICGRAEQIPVRTGWADAVIVAQAFHWFDRSKALHEIARVLKRRGRLGLIWNVRDESVKWVAELFRITRRDNSTSARHSLDELPMFTNLRSMRVRTVQVHTRDTLMAHVHSRSHVAALDEGARRVVTEAIHRLCDTHPDLVGKDRFELAYVTEAYKAEKESA